MQAKRATESTSAPQYQYGYASMQPAYRMLFTIEVMKRTGGAKRLVSKPSPQTPFGHTMSSYSRKGIESNSVRLTIDEKS